MKLDYSKSISELIDIINSIELTEKRDTAFLYLGCIDSHLLDILEWNYILESLADEIRERGIDDELEKDIRNISLRLISEIGVSLSRVFPKTWRDEKK